VDEERRAAVLEDVLANLGPSDGTVVSTPLTGPSTLKLTEDVIGAVTSKLASIVLRNQRSATKAYSVIAILRFDIIAQCSSLRRKFIASFS
jgi:hypothetical protein